jgi:hypothetical protein
MNSFAGSRTILAITNGGNFVCNFMFDFRRYLTADVILCPTLNHAWPLTRTVRFPVRFPVRFGVRYTKSSVRLKQEFSLSAETEYSAAKNHQIFGFGRIFSTFTYFRPKVTDLRQTLSKICWIRTKFDFGVCPNVFKHYYMLKNN